MDLGLERAGLVCKWQVEIDDYATRVLEKHWPNVRRWRDVRDFPPGDPDEWRVDCIAGGFPCQDISVAGKRVGITGERSGLWSEFARLIRILRPRFAVVENVAALLDGGIRTVLRDLAAVGFDAEWDCLPACAFGAPHERDRVFLVAYPAEVAGRRSIFPDRQHEIPRDEQWSSAQGVQSGRRWKRWLNAAAVAVDGQVSSTDFRGMDDGLPEGLGLFGNAVVPQVAEWIGRRLMECWAEERRREAP